MERLLKETQDKLREAEGTDPLTRLASKTRTLLEIEHHIALINRLHNDQSEIADDRNFAVLFIDLDGFKAINDGNHIRGDRILVEFADYLRISTREADIVARFGGDEFFVLAPNTTLKQAESLCKKITKGLQEYIFDSDHGESFSLGASIGVASTSEGIMECTLLIKTADARMQKQKEENRQKRQ